MIEDMRCPGCGRHCPLSAPGCERGEALARAEAERGEEPRRLRGLEEGPGPGGHHGPGHHGPEGPHGHDAPPPPPPHGPRHGPHIDREQYEKLDTDGKLLAMIRALSHASRFHFDDRGGQNRALRLLREDGAMTQRELTERLGIQPGSASELVGKLERAGLISRTPSETDRRTADITLTPAGLARREEGAGREREVRREMFAALTEEEKATLLGLLEKLHAAWRKMRPEPPARGPHGPHGPEERE